jgi:O-antigen ligase
MEQVPVSAQPRAEHRVAAVILSLGALAAVLVTLQWKVFELDRYFVPKELVLNAAGLVVTGAVVLRRPVIRGDAADWLLALFLGWSAISALLATNHWLAQRALAVSMSSAAVFWCARSLSAMGFRRLLLASAAVAGTIAAITSLLQAYGLESEFFTLARAPGGTLGNRNFIAHIAAITLPAAAWCTVTARRSGGALAGYLAVGVLAAVLVLSRSRAAWLAVICSILVIAIPLMISRRHWSERVGARLAVLLLSIALGGLVAIALPNSLNWRSDSPYLDTARNVVDYSTGSGRGRVAQYMNSLEIVRADPVFGAGPGNWPVRYVRYAPRGDKSLTESGMTANPWPSSDWIAFLSERGVVAAAALLGVFTVLFAGALRRWKELPDGESVLAKVALAATIVATGVVSAFDAVLLLPAPAFIAWLAIGAAAGGRRTTRSATLSPGLKRLFSFTALLLMTVAVVRSATMVKAMTSVRRGGNTAGWVEGARWDPGSYRINQRVAELQASRRRCGSARPYARRAAALFPDAPAPRRILRRCR